MEIWKDVLDYEGIYKVSNFGNVKSLKFGKERILKKNKNTTGYFHCCLSKNKTKTNFLIHRLVGFAFIENTENKCDINHINGIKIDNHIDNLEWNTRSENLYHSFANGLSKKQQGEKSKQSKLKDEDILFIRNSKLRQYQLALIFGVDQSLISYIKTKKIWNHI